MSGLYSAYVLVSVAYATSVVISAIDTHKYFFDIVIDLTSSKVNLAVFFNCIFALLMTISKAFIFIFFG